MTRRVRWWSRNIRVLDGVDERGGIRATGLQEGDSLRDFRERWGSRDAGRLRPALGGDSGVKFFEERVLVNRKASEPAKHAHEVERVQDREERQATGRVSACGKGKRKEGRLRNAYTEVHATRNTVMKIRCAVFRLSKIVVHSLSGFPRICSQMRTAMKE